MSCSSGQKYILLPIEHFFLIVFIIITIVNDLLFNGHEIYFITMQAYDLII